MRVTILVICALVAAAVFATILVSIWSSHREGARPASLRQPLAAELVWAAVPCLMVLAAAIPAALAILSSVHDR